MSTHSGGRRHFSLAEANSLLDLVSQHLRTALAAQQSRKRAQAALLEYRRHLVLSGGVVPNAGRLSSYEDEAKTAHGELSRAVNELEDLGVEVKDIDKGLVDFPTRYRGATVYLCYRIGEAEIAYWHALDAGFAGRQPIDDDFRREHSGDPLS